MSDKRIGTWEQTYKPLLFEKETQPMIARILTDLGKIKRENFVEMIDEIDLLLPRMYPMIEFIDDNLIIEKDISFDVIDSIKTLRRISEPQNIIWKKNKDILDLWIEEPERIR